MIPTWPTSLPGPQRDSWQLTRQDPRRRRQADTGPPGYRRRFSSAARLVTMSLVLTRSQKGVFDTFFQDDCRWGVRFFRMPDPSTDGWAALDSNGDQILTSDDQKLLLARTWLCAWGEEMPVETVVEQVKFSVSFNIVVIR
ncbi:MAG: hypothetical protein CML68_20285 [Rhodobacteraceae bacterium]|nr:hypothetical protein [Paracoccaceae bacterium]